MTMRDEMLLRFLTSSILSEYDDKTVWNEASVMENEGLLVGRGLYTGCASFALTNAGRQAALSVIEDMDGTQEFPDKPQLGQIAVRRDEVYTWAGWKFDADLTNALRAKKGER